MAASPAAQEELKQFTKDKLVFFVVATYGEGEPTDNAQEAYKLYKDEEHDPGCMANTNFVVRNPGDRDRDRRRRRRRRRRPWDPRLKRPPATAAAAGWTLSLAQVFGLGNKTYEHYNSMGKFWDTRLAELGGNRVFEIGLGDDDGKWVLLRTTGGALREPASLTSAGSASVPSVSATFPCSQPGGRLSGLEGAHVARRVQVLQQGHGGGEPVHVRAIAGAVPSAAVVGDR